jgi:lipopolysaccharide/colanic/teichoic acid biosynthesis glycosyltransferase
MTKRTFDVIVSFLGLVMLAPVFLLIAAAIKLSDRGPVFFYQERIGLRGKQFRIRKFRTMRLNAEKEGPSITKAGDSRVTKLGAVLRKWKLDELPQLFNVFCGEMAIVGPRPEVPCYVALYTEEQRRVLALRPGITDLATLRFRNEEAMLAKAENPEAFYREYCIPKKIALNLEYAKRARLVTDIALIFATLAAIFTGAD